MQAAAEQEQGAYFLPEFALSPQGSFLEDTTGEQFLTYRYDDQVSQCFSFFLLNVHMRNLLLLLYDTMYATMQSVHYNYYQIQKTHLGWLKRDSRH